MKLWIAVSQRMETPSAENKKDGISHAQGSAQGGPYAALDIAIMLSDYDVPGQAGLTSSKQLEDLFTVTASPSADKARLEYHFLFL